MKRRSFGALGAFSIILLLSTGASDAAAQSAAVGVPQCDRYVQVYRCMVSKLPATSRAAAQRALTQMVTKWRAIALKGAAMKRALGKGCARAVKALSKAVHRVPQLRGCIKGSATPPPRPPASPPRGKNTPPPVKGGATGVRTCDALLARYRCFVNNLPQATRASAWKAYRRMERAIATAVQNARRKGRINEASKGCTSADQGLLKAFARNPYGKTCVGANVAAPPPNTPTPPTDPKIIRPSRVGLAGIPACAKYIAMTRCFVSHLPGDAQRYAAMSLKATVQKWNAMLRRGQRTQVIRKCFVTYKQTRSIVARDPTSRACAR